MTLLFSFDVKLFECHRNICYSNLINFHRSNKDSNTIKSILTQFIISICALFSSLKLSPQLLLFHSPSLY